MVARAEGRQGTIHERTRRRGAARRGGRCGAQHQRSSRRYARRAGRSAATLPRADARDVLVLRAGVETPATLATGSVRGDVCRSSCCFPKSCSCEIRGNVDTRLRKIGEQHVADGTILAAAGLNRLGIETWPGVEFAPPSGFMTWSRRSGRGRSPCNAGRRRRRSFAAIFDAATARAVDLERAFQAALGGGCHTAFAAHVTGDTLYFFHENIGRTAWRSLSPISRRPLQRRIEF